MRHLQIVDDHGRPRLSLSTDLDGKAKIEFISPDHNKNSIIEQFRDGNILLQLAGGGQRPSVSLTTDFQLGGPSLIMRGIGDHQTILLGFPAGDTMAPTQPGSNWGLLFPGM